MPLYTLHHKQNLPISRTDAWEFMSDPANLARITPDVMNFKIISGADRGIYAGQIILYKVSPIKGFRVNWVTEITHVRQNEFFVDEQRHGPYAFWHHKHFLKEIPGGVEMEDIVHYKLPMGILGRLFHNVLVKPKLESIFQFRKQKLIQLFGDFNADNS